jgi:AhpD family alkylhydroperoxidase
MTNYKIHNIETAPEGSKETLKTVQANLGGIPNLAAGMAESPSLVKGFFGLRAVYMAGTFSDADIQVLSIANAVANGCAWCVAFHSFFALKAGVSATAVDALRAGKSPAEPRYKALADFTRVLIEERGKPSAKQQGDFLAAGFTQAQALEVVVGVAFSTMANYAGNLIDAPLDAMFAAHEWAS